MEADGVKIFEPDVESPSCPPDKQEREDAMSSPAGPLALPDRRPSAPVCKGTRPQHSTSPSNAPHHPRAPLTSERPIQYPRAKGTSGGAHPPHECMGALHRVLHPLVDFLLTTPPAS